MRQFRILQGDALAVLRTLPAESVHCCVTSPPYFGLRDYGVPGQIGLELSYPDYVARLLEVFREVRRVLRSDGTLWLNIGDSYATGAGKVGECPGGGKQGERWKGYRGGHDASPKHADGAIGPMTQANRLPQPGLKPKDLMMIPARVALALQADGWYLRSDIIWAKPNPMPESVTDRPTKAHEYLFLLSKSERYFYDYEAIKEPAICGDPRKPYCPGQVDARGDGHARGGGKVRPSVARGGFSGKTEQLSTEGRNAFRAVEDWRNKRTVWTVTTSPFPEAHFATFPPALVEPCILAGCPEGGMVIDPFCGSGTTGMVALRHGRQFIGIELNPEYVAMARRRIEGDAPLLNVEVQPPPPEPVQEALL